MFLTQMIKLKCTEWITKECQSSKWIYLKIILKANIKVSKGSHMEMILKVVERKYIYNGKILLLALIILIHLMKRIEPLKFSKFQNQKILLLALHFLMIVHLQQMISRLYIMDKSSKEFLTSIRSNNNQLCITNKNNNLLLWIWSKHKINHTLLINILHIHLNRILKLFPNKEGSFQFRNNLSKPFKDNNNLIIITLNIPLRR